MNRILVITFILICTNKINGQAVPNNNKPGSSFSFVLMSDIHIKPDVVDYFQKVIDTINKMDIDFVVAAGDLVFDVMRGNVAKSDSLYILYKTMIQQVKVPVYNCIGNHELLGIYPESDIDSTHADYKYGMYERYFGKTYYTFKHKGWQFIVLNSINVNKEKKYYGIIDSVQQEWLKKELQQTDTATPLAIVTHIPFLSTYSQRYGNNKNITAPEPNGNIIYNRQEILNLFDPYNLKLVMQAHIHWTEDILINNKTHFITSGAVAGRPSWRGTVNGEKAFMKITVNGDSVSYRIINYDK